MAGSVIGREDAVAVEQNRELPLPAANVTFHRFAAHPNAPRDRAAEPHGPAQVELVGGVFRYSACPAGGEKCSSSPIPAISS